MTEHPKISRTQSGDCDPAPLASDQTREDSQRMIIEVELYEDRETGHNVAECRDPPAVTHKRRGSALCDLARVLADQHGVPISATLRVTRRGIPAFEDAPLGDWAKLAVSERDAGTIRFNKWQPNERFG